jgi:MFS transporter, PAT family, beta-lactamase induction signal transducer AmpG
VHARSEESFRNRVLNRRIVICAFTGFASGLPFFFLIQLLPGWLRSEGVDLKQIGLLALVQLPYVWKFVWSPLLDRYQIPLLGRRRGWMLLTQVLLLGSMVLVGLWQPMTDLRTILWLAGIVAFFSATQDIVLDAYRRELLPDLELGLGNAVHVQTYRIAGLIPGSLALVLSDHLDWQWVITIVALFMMIGVGLTLSIREAVAHPVAPQSLRQAIIEPFREFVSRRGLKYALLALAFMFFYKLGDSMATALSTPFYLDLGFSRTEIGLIAKNAALWPSIVGGLLGGVLMVRIGINRALWVFGIAQMLPIFGFAVLSELGPNPWALAIVIALEYLGVGLGTAAFVAFIARETTPALAATQFALFTALTALPRTLANATTGFLVEGDAHLAAGDGMAVFMKVLVAIGVPEDGLGWTRFFYLCAVCALPGMLMLRWVAPYNAQAETAGPSH